MISDRAFPDSVAVLGATGSVGRQALDVAAQAGVSVSLMSANNNVAAAEELIRAFRPAVFVMAEERAARELAVRVADTGTKVYGGPTALCDAVKSTAAPVVIHAMLGEAGLAPLLAAADTGKRIGLANKESLVIAGDIVRERVRQSGATVVPVDSEHSAIFQCLQAGRREDVDGILLTASGGPFFGYTKEMLEKVTKAQALAHPTWRMGEKITVDSATLMNKGFEVIEAVRLFDVAPEKIRVVIHRESIIHSAVSYADSAVIAQMGVPDMRLCVQYAMTYPHRCKSPVKPLSLADVGRLTFSAPDTETFPLLSLAFRAISLGGGVPAALNAANEMAVAAFLREELCFTGIFRVVAETVEKMAECRTAVRLEERLAADTSARRLAEEIIKKEKERLRA